MTRVLSVALLMGVAAVVWLSRGRRPRLLASTDASAVASLNRAQISRALDGPAESDDAAGAGGPGVDAMDGPPPLRGLVGRDRLAWLQVLRELSSGSSAERLQAMRLCSRFRDPGALPLIRRGLRDADAAVVAEAARQMARYRGPVRPSAARDQSPLPRNVARTR
ncbi:hypothetical protein EVJ50_08165 [Synechococcus sp. RSCCF101]|uniref:hypothetical protein n=1 Tax=Synechococcus sp. RSCCF101 TaxID=2511069 RepID=UPI0012463183|nr:hypothetical protein [Synechococcus sp. RSCCF101]QEY32204.1 hypothetical protein EVJ50_08165 [Synechococcus sp. RSCCF101]